MLRFSRRLRRPLAVAAALAALAGLAHADDVSVELDQARLLHLPDGVATLVIGNPMVADGTLQPGGLLIVTGKSYGRTNLIALDQKGKVLAEHDITVGRVRGDTVTVYRGGARETLSCAPNCEPTVTLGDNKDMFDLNSKQFTERSNLSTGRTSN